MSEQAKERYEKIEALRKAGDTVEGACKKVGTTSASYYTWRPKLKPNAKKSAKNPSKLKVFDIPAAQAERGFIVFGSAPVLAQFARD